MFRSVSIAACSPKLIHHFLGRQLFHVSVHIANEDNPVSANNKPNGYIIIKSVCPDFDASKRSAPKITHAVESLRITYTCIDLDYSDRLQMIIFHRAYTPFDGIL